MRPRLLQVANVGQICGGTAACAWTVTRALPGFEHQVVFLSPITAETRQVFAGCSVFEWRAVTSERVLDQRPDIVVLHNISTGKCLSPLPVPIVQYVHSVGAKAAADVTVYCSRWLADQMGAATENVLWQAVPRVKIIRTSAEKRPLVIGRICTPQSRKWPEELVAFYGQLAPVVPAALWEFIGCPDSLQPRLSQACGGRAKFTPAGWEQRHHLGRWDVLLYHHPTLPESFGRVVAEAMRAGCVPIVDDLGGFREQLDLGGGYLCRDVTHFQQALADLGDSEVRAEASQRAVRMGEQRWSLDRFARDLLTCFEQAATVSAARRKLL